MTLPSLPLNSFNRSMCENLAEVVTEEFEEREKVIRSQDGPKTLKLAEKRQVKAEKKLKKARDETEQEKGKR